MGINPTVEMVKRQGVQQGVLGCEAPRFRQSTNSFEQTAMTEQNPLWLASRTTRVENERSMRFSQLRKLPGQADADRLKPALASLIVDPRRVGQRPFPITIAGDQ